MATIQCMPRYPYLVTGWGHRKIEPKTKQLSHCKKKNLVGQTILIVWREIRRYLNHAQKSSEKTQIIFIDNLIINLQFIISQQTHPKRVLHWIDLQEHWGEHGIENQRERRSHLATSYGPIGLSKLLTLYRNGNGVDVDALRDRIPLRQDAEKGPKMGSHGYGRLRRWKSCFVAPPDAYRV